MAITQDVAVNLSWYHRPQNFHSFVVACRAHLQRLAEEARAFSRWHVMAKDGAMISLGSDLAELEEVLTRVCYEANDPERYFSPNPAGGLVSSPGALGRDSYSQSSFRASFVASDYVQRGSDDPTVIGTTVDCGGLLPGPNAVGLRVPFDRRELLEPGKVVGIVHALTALWRSNVCTVDGHALRRAAHHGQAQPRVRAVSPGWMTHLRVRDLARYLPDDIDRDDLHDEGVLIYACRELADASNDEHIQRMRRISEVLEDFCLTQDPVLLHGWPDTANERSYRRQVTGTPEDRAYRVALSDFSAWDRSRKVLIWTRLFENSNADTFNYKPTYVKPLACMPEVAEARKQLRSLALAGADCPIEWHVGRQELVEPLRVLLHEHAGVDKAKLSVVDTQWVEDSV